MKKRGSSALGTTGIIVTIILFELLAGYFTYAITRENIKNVFVSNCDCNYIGGCSSYVAINGINALIDRCGNQTSSNTVLQDAVSNAFFNLTIVGIIILLINISMVIIIILVIRGVPG